MEKKYLPIGSVVRLKEGTKRLMITGFLPIENEEKEDRKVWDYCGCLYPEGIISSKQMALFDHSQIEKIFYLGYSDDEDKSFKKAMVEELNKMIEQQKNAQN